MKAVGDVNSTERPQDRADVARFYAIVLPVQTWNPAARQVITPHNCVWVIVGDASVVRPQLEGLGLPIETMTLP